MLSPSQVIPFLRHTDRWIVSHAANYLADVRELPAECGPMALDLLRRPDRINAYPLLKIFRRVAPNIDIIRSAFDFVGYDDHFNYAVMHAFADMDVAWVSDHAAEFLAEGATILPRLQKFWRHRLEARDKSESWLWDELERAIHRREEAWDVDSESGETSDVSDASDESAEVLVDALSRLPQSAPRALAMLTATHEGRFAEIYAAELLGRLRFEPAIGPLLQKLTIDDSDFVREEATNALAEIGSAAVVEEIEAEYPSQEWSTKLYMDDPLENIKLPRSEAALIRLLESETDSVLRTHLAQSLCALCTTDGIELVRQMVKNRAWDLTDCDLDEDLLLVAMMTGYDLPEADDIRRDLADTEKRARERAEIVRREREQSREEWEGAETLMRELESKRQIRADVVSDDADYDNVVLPIRREAPKVGRNDPCPCGSRKKFKKCCGI